MQNEDIFENFYDENQELYNEISHELLKMKKIHLQLNNYNSKN